MPATESSRQQAYESPPRSSSLARRMGRRLSTFFRPKLHHKRMSRREATYWKEALRALYLSAYGLTMHPLESDASIVPPKTVIEVVQGRGKDDPTTFFASGYRETLRYHTLLRAHGFDVTRMRRMLDLGVGTGRVLVHFLPFAIERHGCDVAPEAYAWTSRTLGAYATLHQTSLRPELPFADDFFDLIIATSVFTHMPYAAQPAWIRELRRVLAPGGCVLATVQDFAKLPCEARERGWHETGTERGIHMRTFLSESKVVEVWGASFGTMDVRAYPPGQAFLLAVNDGNGHLAG